MRLFEPMNVERAAGEADLKFVNPPVNEVGLSITFVERPLVSDYDIREFHDLFRDEFPQIERAFAAPGPEILPVLGAAPLNSDPRLGRWWFKSPGDDYVLQVQENFLGLNWRRKSALHEPSQYPGFDVLVARFLQITQKAQAWVAGKGGVTPKPFAGELLYDDLIRALPNAEGKTKLSDILTFWPDPSLIWERETPMQGWTSSWLEPLGYDPGGQLGWMRFTAVAAAAIDEAAGGKMVPIVRLSFNGMSAIDGWDRVDPFFQRAHKHILERFFALVRLEARAAWEVA